MLSLLKRFAIGHFVLLLCVLISAKVYAQCGTQTFSINYPVVTQVTCTPQGYTFSGYVTLGGNFKPSYSNLSVESLLAGVNAPTATSTNGDTLFFTNAHFNSSGYMGARFNIYLQDSCGNQDTANNR